MATRTKLMLLKTAHAMVFLLMVSATLFVAYCGISGYRSPVLVATVALVLGEGLVLIANRMECPLTKLAKHYGSPRGWALDWALPESWSRGAMWLFGAVFAWGVVLLMVRG